MRIKPENPVKPDDDQKERINRSKQRRIKNRKKNDKVKTDINKPENPVPNLMMN